MQDFGDSRDLEDIWMNRETDRQENRSLSEKLGILHLKWLKMQNSDDFLL